MPFYKVMLRGHNFPGHPLGKPRIRFGLYTTRWVQALNSRRAEFKAVALAWADPKLAIPDAKRPQDRAWFKVERVDQIRQLPRKRGSGAIWFEEGTSERRVRR